MKISADINKVEIVNGKALSGEFNVRDIELELAEELTACQNCFLVVILKNGTSIDCPIEGGEVEFPCILKPQNLKIGVYAYDMDDSGKITKCYSPEPCNFFVDLGSYKEGGNSPHVPSPEEYTKLKMLMAKAEQTSNKVTEITEESTDEQYPSAKATYTGILKEKSRANNNFANAVKGVANGPVVRIDDVSPIEHTVKINVQGDIETAIVNKYGKNLFHINECNLETTEPWGAKRIGDIDIRTGKYVASCNFKQVGADKSEVALSIRNKDDVTQIIKTVKSTDVEGSLICPFDVSEGVNGVVLFLYSNVTESYLSTECDFTHIQIEAGESATDFEVYKGKETYTPDENGDVTVKSVSPTMTFTTDNGNVTLSCEYNKDLNKDIDKLSEELAKKPSGKVFEKIATYTVIPDADGNLPTKIVISKDDSGNAFQLTDIYCDVVIGMTAGKNGRFYIQAGTPTENKVLAIWGNGNIDLRDGALRKWCFRYDSFGEGNGGLMTAPNATLALTADFPSANVSNLFGQPIPIGKTLDITEVRFIGQIGEPLTFMEGTTITLWGVRK